MATNHLSAEIVSKNKVLVFNATSLSSDYVSKHIEPIVREAFLNLAPYMQKDTQVLTIKDVPSLCTDGQPFTYFDSEQDATIAIPTWVTGHLDMKHLSLAVHQALFQMARQQNIGLSQTLGEEIFNLGVAAYYAHRMTGWEPSFAEQKVSRRMRRMALRRWGIKYRGYSRWLTNGRLGRIGRAIGYELAKVNYASYSKDRDFALDHALQASGSWYADKLWALNHPRSMRALLCMVGKGRRPFWAVG